MRLFPLIFAACLAMTPAQALDSSAGKLTVTKMVDRLNDPWALGFLPDGGLLITEKAGRVLYIENGQRRELSGLPDVATQIITGGDDYIVADATSLDTYTSDLTAFGWDLDEG